MKKFFAFLIVFFLSAELVFGDKILNSASCSESEFKDTIESMLPKLPDWRKEELKLFKEESTGIGYASAALFYSINHTFFINDYSKYLTVDSILNASMHYMAASRQWKDEYAPYLIYNYASRLHEKGYNEFSAVWASVGVLLLRKHNNGDRVYGQLRCLESELEIDSLPSRSMKTQLAMLKGFENDSSALALNSDILYEQYFRAMNMAIRIGDFEKADSIYEVALDRMFDRKNPDVISGKISVLQETNPWMFRWKAIESEFLIHKGKIKEAIEVNRQLLYRFVENKFIGSIKMEDFPIFFKSVEFLAQNNGFDDSNLEMLLFASEYIREYLCNVVPTLSPIVRNRFYETARKTIKIINSELIKSIKEEEVRGTIYNNILLFKGLDLITDRILHLEKIDSFKRKASRIDWDNILFVLIDYHYRLMDDDASKLKASNFNSWISADWKKTAASLSQNGTGIEFFKIDDSETPTYYAASICKDSKEPQIIKIADENVLREALDTKGSYLNSSMYDKIWGKIFNAIDNPVDTIYFSPDGLLHIMPIEYLPISKGNTYRPLADKYTVFRLSSTKNILINHVNPATQKLATLAGGITYGSIGNEQGQRNLFDDFDGVLNPAPLSGTLEEVVMIDSLLKSHDWDVRMYIGTQATKDKILNGKSKIEHIASHGFYITDSLLNNQGIRSLPFLKLNTDDPNSALSRSGLLLSQDSSDGKNGYNGIITAYDISQTDKSGTDLVTLSLCQSGLGEIKDDGVYGLQRAYKIAGANSMLISLWDVSDKATMILMKEFYKNYLNGASKHQSLREAQKAVREFDCSKMDISGDFSSPKYWAGFILLDGQ